MKCKMCGHELPEKQEWVILSSMGIEVQQKQDTAIDSYSKIVIPEGMRLLTLSEFLNIWNEHRALFDFGGDLPDEVIAQPIKENAKKYPYWNVWFHRIDDGDQSVLVGNYRDLHYGYRVGGVRFCREIKK